MGLFGLPAIILVCLVVAWLVALCVFGFVSLERAIRDYTGVLGPVIAIGAAVFGLMMVILFVVVALLTVKERPIAALLTDKEQPVAEVSKGAQISMSAISGTIKIRDSTPAVVPDGEWQPLFDEPFTVPAHKFVTTPPIVLAGDCRLKGTFRATGGSANDIRVVITDERGVQNLGERHESLSWYDSGKVTLSAIDAQLRPGTFYVVFDNGFSPVSNKVVMLQLSKSCP
jgi:hypothetical protein